MDAGLWGGIIGGVLGILGGVIGTRASIRNTGGPEERAFMVRAATVAWLGIIAFLALLLLLPRPYSYLMWVVYGIALPAGIIYSNRRQGEIRARELQRRQRRD